VKERDFERVFELAELPADSGLAEIQGLTCVREATCLSNGMKYPEFVPVHGHDEPISPF